MLKELFPEKLFHRHACLALVLPGAILLLSSCSSTSPRFTGKDDGAAVVAPAPKPRTEEEPAAVPRPPVANAIPRSLQALPPRESDDPVDDTPAGISRDELLLDVLSYLGVPYAYGGTSKKGIDCSGFTSKIFAASTWVTLARSTRDQYRQGRKVPKDELKFGDLVFFNTNGHSPSHVGIYIEDDLFVHASTNDGVTFSSMESSYYKQRFVGARRVLE